LWGAALHEKDRAAISIINEFMFMNVRCHQALTVEHSPGTLHATMWRDAVTGISLATQGKPSASNNEQDEFVSSRSFKFDSE
jgi:hypothetical protein